MKFGIVIKHERRNIRLRVETISNDGIMAIFKITARNDTFILKTNKPLLISKGLKYKKAEWKVIDGGHHRVTIIDLITKEIEKNII